MTLSLLSIKKKKLFIGVINQQVILRKMHSEPLISNAFLEAMGNDAQIPEATRQFTYIANMLGNENLPISVIIQNASNELGYFIHPQSFIALFQSMHNVILTRQSSYNAVLFIENLQSRDDLGLFYGFNATEVFNLNERKNTVYFNCIDRYLEPKNTAFVDETNNNNEKASDNVATSKALEDSGSDTSSNVSTDNIDTSNIMWIIAIAAFSFIIAGIFYIIHKQKKEQDNKEVIETVKESDDVQSCIMEYEFWFLKKVFIQVFVLLVPLLVILYSFRYYYYHRYLAKVKHKP